jgi:hypothetical protein
MTLRDVVPVSLTNAMTTTRITSSLIMMRYTVTVRLPQRAILDNGFFCPRKDAMITDERYCRHVCDRQGVNCEHRKTKYAQHHF